MLRNLELTFYDQHNGKNLTSLLAEMKEDLREFVTTRFVILKTEMQDKVRTLKTAAPLGIAAALLLSTAYLLFSPAILEQQEGRRTHERLGF